jgi:CubicO group peptidase (beta-lactamase class C family)
MRRALACALGAAALLTACAPVELATTGPGSDPPATDDADRPARSAGPAEAKAVRAIVRQEMAEKHLKAVIIRVTKDGKEILTEAFGESMTKVPATTEMHFRNGAVAISYVATLLFVLVDEGTVSLDDKVSKWLPDVRFADQVTLGQLAQMTSGYFDYVQDPGFLAGLDADPYRQWTPQELIEFGTSHPLQFQPGTNWAYAHTNYVILGLALEKATGKKMSELMEEKVLEPLGLENTTDPDTPAIPDPALHAFTSERRSLFKVPEGTPFYEEATYWNPSWTITHGAIQTTNIFDLHDTAVAVGTGKLLSRKSYQKMIAPTLRGKTHPQPGCPTCAEMIDFYTFGYGVVISGHWLLQNPLFYGEASVEAYLPAEKIAIAAVGTYEPEAFDANGQAPNLVDGIFRKVGALLAPDDPPPLPPTG